MPGRIRVRKHEAVPGCGSFEAQVPGRGSKLLCGRSRRADGLRPEVLTQEQALKQARAFARAERDGG